MTERQRSLELVPSINLNFGSDYFYFNWLPEDIRYVPPHPNDTAAHTDPIETDAGNTTEVELGLGIKIDFWQYVFLKYQWGLTYMDPHMAWSGHEGNYTGNWPPDHRQRYASGENALTFISLSNDDRVSAQSHYITVGFTPFSGVERPDSRRPLEFACTLEAGVALKKYFLVRGWDRYASAEIMDTVDVNLWGVVIALNLPLVWRLTDSFGMGFEAGMRMAIFPEGSFYFGGNMSVLFSFKL
jgi:hypothetical protein